MIEKAYGKETLVCDDCGDTLNREFEPGAFMEMIAYAKGQGWTVRKVDHEYDHFCPDCKPTGLAAQKALFGLR